MRKSKDIKRKRETATAEFRKGNEKEAYKLWREAAAERVALQAKKRGTKDAAAQPES